MRRRALQIGSVVLVSGCLGDGIDGSEGGAGSTAAADDVDDYETARVTVSADGTVDVSTLTT